MKPAFTEEQRDEIRRMIREERDPFAGVDLDDFNRAVREGL